MSRIIHKNEEKMLDFSSIVDIVKRNEKYVKGGVAMASTKRVQIDLSGEVFDSLEVLRESSGTTMSNVFRNALKVYKFLKEEEAKKSTIIVESKNGDKKHIIIP
jgi:hypothetical protein